MGARKALCKPHLAFSETKLALLPGSAAHPVQNSPSKRPWQAHPVQNSPSKPQNADFGPPFACRENFLPLPPPTTRAGRTLSRMRGRFRYKTLPASGLGRPTRYKTLPAARLGDPPGTKLSLPPGSATHPVQNSPCRPARRPTRYKTLPASGLGRPTRYKTLPASPKTPISGHFSHAGRTFYRFRHQHDEQGEKSHAPTLHRTPTTCRSPNFACNSIA